MDSPPERKLPVHTQIYANEARLTVDSPINKVEVQAPPPHLCGRGHGEVEGWTQKHREV